MDNADSDFIDDLPFDVQAFCPKCGRYYNPKTPHTCFPDDVNVEVERKKLRRWLGDDVETL